MGRAVYENNFNEKGHTFLVDSVLYDLDEGYANHVKEFGDEAISEIAYIQQEYESHYQDFVREVQSGARHFFMAVQERLEEEGARLPENGTAESGRAAFDGDFRCAYDYDDEIQVGILEEDTTYVVGVSLVRDPMDDDPMTVVLEHGMGAEDYKNHQVKKVEALAAYLRYHLAQNAFEPEYRTSFHTTAAYVVDNPEQAKRDAVENFVELHLASSRPTSEVLAENFRRKPEEATVRILQDGVLFEGEWNYDADRRYANYVVYDSNSRQVVLLDGEHYEVINETAIEIEDPRRLLLADPDLGYHVLDLANSENVELIAGLQHSLEDTILITPQAFERASGRDFFDEVRETRPSPSP